ncbi:hypothetical protein [Actinomadura sp. BRA 177]|uniref:hypothetical protein n=1 Tax=Actinomadura sp. BRA 177 TaxID=2745202 RepID=UPI001595E70F|nr:hypothetical protein [Actinomadura sp. BRA 177]NVI89732.1 hypothetical protein [Actinomadura sp. BRA 177]
MQMNRPGVLEALTLLPEDPHIVSRYRSLAQSTAGSPDVPPDALAEIIALTRELKPPFGLRLFRHVDLDLDRVNDALVVLAKTNSSLPIEARAHLRQTLIEGLRAVIHENSAVRFSLERAAKIERTAELADFLYPGKALFRSIARDAYGSWAWTEQIPVGCGCVATLSISLVYPLVAVAWLGWARAVPVAFLSWLGLGLLIFLGLSVGHIMRREARRRKARALHQSQPDR